MSELKVPTFLDFINAGSADPLREDMFEKLLDERDMLYEALHVLVLQANRHTRTKDDLAAMDKARAALDAINPEWRHEHTG